jgi:hypothetical protein
MAGCHLENGMLNKTRFAKLKTIGVTLALASVGVTKAQAQWLTHSGGGASTTATFNGVGGAYAGTVMTTMSVVVDGGNDGVPGLSAISDNNLTGAFLANYPTNGPNGTFEALGLNYNHTRDYYRVRMDFSGLQNGYLPAGTVMAVADLDIWEDFEGMQAFDLSGNIIPPIWLNALPGQQGFLDYNNSDGFQSNLTPPVLFNSFMGMRYDFIGIDSNESSGLLGYRTAYDIKTLSFSLGKHVAGSFTHVGGAGLGFAAPVPEPASMIAIGIGALGLLGRRRLWIRHGR